MSKQIYWSLKMIHGPVVYELRITKQLKKAQLNHNYEWLSALHCSFKLIFPFSRSHEVGTTNHNTLSDKISSDKIFVGQNISSNKIFDTKPKFRQVCPVFAWLLYWNIGQNFRRTKFFVGQNFRHQPKISTLLSDEFLSDKVYEMCGACGKSFTYYKNQWNLTSPPPKVSYLS